MAEPVKKYFRLFPGNEVRLKSAYYVTCNSYDTDENGEVTCLHCTYDPESRGGETPDGRKVRGTLHWVSAADNVKAQVRLYDRLFNTENPAGEDGNGDYLQNINPDSLKLSTGACSRADSATQSRATHSSSCARATSASTRTALRAILS